jgi:hypothetical protein
LAGTLLFFALKSSRCCCVGSWGDAPEDPLDCAERHDQTVYLVLDDFGRLGRTYPETAADRADLESVISDLMSGQFNTRSASSHFNTAEHWAEDASEDIARKIMRRLDLAGDELPSALEEFVERHLGPERQLTLRLA